MRWQLFDLLTVQNLFRIKMILLNRVHTNYNSAIFTERESLSSFFSFCSICSYLDSDDCAEILMNVLRRVNGFSERSQKSDFRIVFFCLVCHGCNKCFNTLVSFQNSNFSPLVIFVLPHRLIGTIRPQKYILHTYRWLCG